MSECREAHIVYFVTIRNFTAQLDLNSKVELHSDIVAESPFIVSRRPFERREDVVFITPFADVSTRRARYCNSLIASTSTATPVPGLLFKPTPA